MMPLLSYFVVNSTSRCMLTQLNKKTYVIIHHMSDNELQFRNKLL